ncbi:hypothetical protein GO998_22220 (plasmid) [Ralstonia syzygii]|uniref:Sphingomyelin phosphodiesterase n=2 Tax=Ralstonia syzygii TaxID=28097 RepID=A0ABX7ZNC8_9RALS|nr:hypothetical protein GO998_22220 [Ralstonia syzygii]
MMNKPGRTRRFLAALALSLACAMFPALAGAQAAQPPDLPSAGTAQNPGFFGALSDIHFNPFYDPSLVDKLAAAEPSAWDGIFKTSSITEPAGPGYDTNYPLLKATLDAIAPQARKLDYVILPGDFLTHDFRENYMQYASDTSDAAYRSFVLKTIRYVAMGLKAQFPNVPVIATLGNNDSFCGDYQIEPSSAFLYDLTATMTDAAGSRAGFSAYPELGAYVIPHPRTPRHYFVVLENTFLSAKYRNTCGLSNINPSQAVLLWLEATLYRMKRENATVTLVMHIPSGIDAYSSTRTCRFSSPPVPYFSTANGDALTNILQRYPDQIRVIFTGHSHMDDFRVLPGIDGKPFAYERVIPSISPLFGNNPGYQLYSYERTTGTPVSYWARTYATADSSNTRTWQWEYEFRQAYNVGELSPDTLNTLAATIAKDPATRAKFMAFYTGGANSGTITNQNWPAFACALTNLSAKTFSTCFCGGTQ